MSTSPTDPIPQFGRPIENREYIPRPSVYAIITDQSGRICTVEEDSGLHLPGGGIEPGETPIEALRREIDEELGMSATIGEELGRANEYVETIKKRKSFNKHAIFYRAVLDPQQVPPENRRDSIHWFTIDALESRAAHRMYSWIAGRASETPPLS